MSKVIKPGSEEYIYISNPGQNRRNVLGYVNLGHFGGAPFFPPSGSVINTFTTGGWNDSWNAREERYVVSYYRQSVDTTLQISFTNEQQAKDLEKKFLAAGVPAWTSAVIIDATVKSKK